MLVDYATATDTTYEYNSQKQTFRNHWTFLDV